ncbi:MAG: hypothetical protein H5T98_08940 [Syntrophomonadaceae bacterium]|nr:hypothetical protein [Syntrophomonadaceae bacterium]
MNLVKIYYQSNELKLPVSQLDLHPDLVEVLEEIGVIEVENGHVDIKNFKRLHRIMRLKNFLGVNLVGATIIVDLLERIEELEEQLKYFEK